MAIRTHAPKANKPDVVLLTLSLSRLSSCYHYFPVSRLYLFYYYYYYHWPSLGGDRTTCGLRAAKQYKSFPILDLSRMVSVPLSQTDVVHMATVVGPEGSLVEC